MAGDRIPPSAEQVERTVIGSMLISPGLCEYAIRILTDDCFYDSKNRLIFQALKAMTMGFVPIDIVTLAEELRRTGSLDQAGSESYLAELAGDQATSPNIKRHCEILLEKAVLRGMIATFSRGSDYAFSPDATPEKVLAAAERRIFDYRKRMQVVGHEQVYEHSAEVERFVESVATPLPKGVSGIPWPVEAMTRLTGGAPKGKTTVLSGFSKGGKSRFLRCCVSHWLQLGYSGVYVLTEEDKDAVIRCIFASRCKIDTRDMVFHKCTDTELEKLRQEKEAFAAQNLYIERQICASPAFVSEALDRAGNDAIKRGKTLDFCILDTCSKMEKDGYGDDKARMHQDMAENLLKLASGAGVAMIEVMQYLSETERGARTKNALHSMMRYGQYYLESCDLSISFDDRRKAKKEIEAEKKRGYKVVKAHVVQREGESFGHVDVKAELKYSHYSDPSSGESEQAEEEEKTFFDGTKDSDKNLPF